jgi:hypothetical protein
VIPIEKPGSPGDILEHHGIKGMKWGRRTGGSSSGGKSKPRGRERSRQFAAKYHTGAARSKEIQRARARDLKRYIDYTTEKDKTKRAKLKKVYLDHPDRATALRTTRGEKVAVGILAGAVVTAPIAVGIGAGLGARTAYRHHVERSQQKKR